MPEATTYPRRGAPPPDAASLWNWAQNSRIAPAGSVAAPTTEDEVRALVTASPGRLRPVGSRMSAGRMLALAADGDAVLDLSGLRGVLSVTDDTATFAGGTPLQEVHDVLAARGRTLTSSPGVIASQTLGGALATGTHGQGLGQSTIGDGVVGLRTVLADGTVRESGRDDPGFGALQLGLGVLGVTTAATLRTQPSVLYTCTKSAVGADSLERDLVSWNTGHALSKAWWFPDEDQVHVWTAREATDDEAAAHRAGGGRLVEHGGASAAMNRTVEATLATMRSDTRIVDPDGRPFRTVSRFKDFTDVTGDVYQVFCRGIATPQINVEIGVPLDRAGAVVQKIKAWHAETRPHLHYPVILRCTGPSSAWLSPSHGQATCYFGFVVYYAEDGSLSADGVDFLREVEQLLAAESGRPHWGKYFDEGLYDWPALYPRWAEFREVREALDPQHRFTNDFTGRLLDGGER